MIRTILTRPRLYAVAAAVWFGMFAIALANGVFQKAALEPWLGDVAKPVSSILAIILLCTVAARCARVMRPRMIEALAIGAVWLALTLVVELILHFAGRPPSGAMADALALVALAKGDLFAPMLLWIAAVPAAMALAGPRTEA
ncbi:hypothetical protein [Blastochloris viridis]|uniref:Uncharacterized protein n=1 Tax=Blastochloris viridis TaxID=1079 RepID=A0A0H5BNQ7_BLAVI|nr:hypothetical protein [Blastochloris viridis]ALK08649.1 hypothetical protein BVIR_856 [Blastochloris viridis]BAR98058.1 hypothetical protein BV133_465 [Blastochloris viridis]CUU41312.1 hypothetical protein BVIRIDIS_03010 [Blastochloris viridis]